jgi:hypothetical protein
MNSNSQETSRIKRPFFLSFLCIIGFTYTVLFSLLFLIGMLYSTGISGMLNKYLQIYDLSRMNFFLLSSAGFLIFFVAFTGIFLMWKMQWLGFYIYTFATILFLSLELVISGFYLPDMIIQSTLILLFFISFLYVRKRKKAISKQTPQQEEDN